MGDVLWFVWLVGVIELVEALHEYGLLVPLIRLLGAKPPEDWR